MSFPRYARYKDSGIEWLDQVPEHWAVRPLWTYFRRVKRVGFAEEELLSVYRDHGVVPKSSRDDNFNKPSEDLSAYQLVLPGDLVVNKMKAWQGSVAISGYRGIVSPAYFVYTPQHSERARFLHYLMRSPEYTAGYLSRSKGIRINQWDLEPDKHSRMPVLTPTLEEQMAIESFLDHETTKIEALIFEQRHLIDVLKEKRQVVISEAVSKGLNPDARMKSSGIEWLGDVPAHWEVIPLRYLCDIQTGSRDTEDAVPDGSYPFFVRSQTVERIDTTTYDCEAILTAGDGAGVGKVFHYYKGRFDFHQRVYMLNNFRQVEGRFLFHYVRQQFYKVALEGGAKSTVDSLRRPMFTSFAVCVPPPAEQEAIINVVECAVREHETLTTEAERAITLLQERRSALISAAVTGKIDVRRLVEAA
jgi:type I restriction enzyme S subunit